MNASRPGAARLTDRPGRHCPDTDGMRERRQWQAPTPSADRCRGERVREARSRNDFSTTIDNTHMPLAPGTQMTYRGSMRKGRCRRSPSRSPTSTRKMANGVTARVVRDTAREDGKIVEDTFDWFAQDDAGQCLVSRRGHRHVRGRAQALRRGVVRGRRRWRRRPVWRCRPTRSPGRSTGRSTTSGHAEDNGQVLSTREMVDVPEGHYNSVLLTRDTSSIEPRMLEYKFYAPGVGTVLILDIVGRSGPGGTGQLTKVPAWHSHRTSRTALTTSRSSCSAWSADQSSSFSCSKWDDERNPAGPRTTATISQASIRIGALPMILEPGESAARSSRSLPGTSRVPRPRRTRRSPRTTRPCGRARS